MKKRKALIILPLLALTLSGCGLFSEGEEDQDENSQESLQEDETESSQSPTYQETLSNYTLRFRLKYEDEYQSLPSWSALYISGSFNDNQYDKLVENNTSFTYSLSSIKAGTYQYRIYLFYNDETFDVSSAVQLIPPSEDATLVISGYEGDNYVNTIYYTLDYSLETLLPDKSSGGGSLEEETFTYQVNVTNSSSLLSMTYDESQATQEGVALDIKLVTISSLYGESSVDATENDVSISGYDSEIINVSGLTIYPLCGDRSTSLVVTWDKQNVSSTTLEVVIENVTTPQPGEEVITYSIDVENASELQNIVYDPELETQEGVTLNIKLITNSSLYGETSVDASINDVSISGYDESIIQIDGLTIYPLKGDSETSLTITWIEKEVMSSLISVKTIVNGSISPTVDNYTLSFTLYDEYNLVQECPSYGSLYIEGSFDETYNETSGYYDWGEPHKLDETTYDGHTSYSYAYSGLEAGKTYEYAIIFVYEGENPSSSWNPVNHPESGYTDEEYWESYNLYITIDTGALTNGSQHQDIQNCYTLESQYPENSETKVYVSNYTLVFTIYDQDNNVQSAAENDSLYIQGGFDGQWIDEYDGYYGWGSYKKLEETTDKAGHTAYKVTYDQLEVGYLYDFNIVYVYEGESVSWSPILQGNNNFYIQISESAQNDDTQYENISVETPIADLYPPKGGSAEINEYKVVFTFYDTNGAVQECPSNGSLYIQGTFANPSSTAWGNFLPLTETTDQSGNKAYYYIFDELVPGATYTFNVVFANTGDNPAWNPVRSSNFSMVIFSASNETGTEYVSLTGCYTFSAQFGLKTNSCTIAVYDTANTGKSLKISGDMQRWQPTVMTYNASNTDYQYSYTFDCSENQALEFGIYTLDSWSDSLQIGVADTNNYVTGTGSNIKIDGKAIGTYSYTLIIFTVNGTNFGGTSHVLTTAVSITH